MGRAEDLMQRIETGGIDAVHELVKVRKHEESFLDFKRAVGLAGGSLDGSDRRNLARAISGFANADGGVIVWGVSTASRTDAADTLSLLDDCRAFAGRLDGQVSGCTVPPVLGVRSAPIPIDSGPRGVVATLVPSSSIGPHQCVEGNVYLIRAGASFLPVTHSVLAGMFGRKPQAQIQLVFTTSALEVSDSAHGLDLRTALTVRMHNSGPTVARDMHVTYRIDAMDGNVRVTSQRSPRWQVDELSPRYSSFLAAPDNRMAPEAVQDLFTIELSVSTPIKLPFNVTFTWGCEGSPLGTREIRYQPDEWAARLIDVAAKHAALKFKAGPESRELARYLILGPKGGLSTPKR